MSVVVIGLQHTQAPLPLLEAVAVSDADLHKMLSELNHRRNVQEAVVLSTCLRTEVYAVVDRFHDAVAEIYGVLSEHSRRSVQELSEHAIGALRRRRHLPSLLRDLGARVRGDRRDRGRGPGPPRLRKGSGRGHVGTRPLGTLPPRAADGEAGAHRDRHQQGHDIVRLRRRHGRPRPRPRRTAQRTRRGGRRRRHGPRRVPRPFGHRARRRATARGRGRTAPRRGQRTWCARRPPGPSTCGRPRSTRWPAS